MRQREDKRKKILVVVVYAYNHSCSGTEIGSQFEASLDSTSKNKLGMVADSCNLSFSEVEVGRLLSDTGLPKSMRPYLQNKWKNTKGLGTLFMCCLA
jgi:hypothetical protein